MADNDFVERLRIRWETMGDMANDERAAAAAEIEFLRRSQRELMAKVAALTTERDEARHGECVATATLQGWIEERTTLRAERDEARRMLCEEWAKQDGLPLDWQGRRAAEGMAEFVKWDCFKENNND